MSFLRALKDLRFRLFYSAVTSTTVPVERVGGESAWNISTQNLSPDSVVVSAGAGQDISFELELVQRFGCRVILLDPSPTGLATLSATNPDPDRLQFLQAGLAAKSGPVTFAPPANAQEGSFRQASPDTPGAFTFECVSLPDLVRRFGLPHIDLLKIDIEGFEYEVIDSFLASGIRVDQFCVEFHHFGGHTNVETARTILRLRKAGLRLIHRIHEDHTFLAAR